MNLFRLFKSLLEIIVQRHLLSNISSLQEEEPATASHRKLFKTILESPALSPIEWSLPSAVTNIAALLLNTPANASVTSFLPAGTNKWTYATGQIDEFGVEGVTVDRNGNLYLANAQGIVMSLDNAGQLRWSLDLAPDSGGNIWPSAPVIGADGILYVGGGYTGSVYAIVPEPATLSLLALGGLAMLRRRK